jgi:hypothetical protein
MPPADFFTKKLRMNPEDLREIISAYQKCVAEIMRRFGGVRGEIYGRRRPGIFWLKNPFLVYSHSQIRTLDPSLPRCSITVAQTNAEAKLAN